MGSICMEKRQYMLRVNKTGPQEDKSLLGSREMYDINNWHSYLFILPWQVKTKQNKNICSQNDFGDKNVTGPMVSYNTTQEGQKERGSSFQGTSIKWRQWS